MVLTYRYRLKETSGARRELSRQAKAVNLVWNFCGETQEAARRWDKRWPSGFDLIALTHGVSRELQLHSDTVQAVCKQFAISRDGKRRRPRWRGKSSLGWIPFQAARAIRLQGSAAIFLKRRYRLWFSRLVEGKIKSGNFAQDAGGRWYLNLQVEVAEHRDCGSGEVAVDLGLKDLATLSTGEKIANPRQLAQYAAQLASAQRAGRKARTRAIHAKIANCRRHFLHELSTRLVRENRRICVGNVSASRLARTSLAKSVLDAGWSQLRSQLRYKAVRHGAEYIEVDERFTTQVCSGCGTLGGPQGREGLVVRDWRCPECGVQHDRDINSAINILVSGRNAGLQLTEIPAL
jgi:IS605 OrfB family transposase